MVYNSLLLYNTAPTYPLNIYSYIMYIYRNVTVVWLISTITVLLSTTALVYTYVNRICICIIYVKYMLDVYFSTCILSLLTIRLFNVVHI